MAKIIILFPNPIATIPGGLTYVAKRFRSNGFETRVFINTFDKFQTMDEIKTEVVDPFQPQIVAFSFGTYNLLEIYRLQDMCQRPGYTVLAGGQHPSIQAEEVLRHGADLVFRGEAELGIDDFCAWYQAGADPAQRAGLRGVSFIDQQGAVQHTKKPRRIMKLDALGPTDFSTVNLDDFTLVDGSIKGLNVISCGRGCPFRCSYCSHSDWYAYAHRSADSILEEMVNRHQTYGLTDFWLSDETFTVHQDHVHEFCRKFRKAGLPFTWSAGTRANAVDERLLKEMKKSGLKQLTYGIESADDETLQRINKGYDSRTAYQAVIMTGQLGIPMYVNLMTGFPWETPRHVQNQVRFIKAVEKYVNCFQLYGAVIPYPDTAIYEEYHLQEGFTEFWLRPKYQNAGMVIYQNVANPYRVSTYYQRNLYDDTYVAEDYFFKFSPDYKRAVAKMGHLIGWKSVKASTGSRPKRWAKYSLGRVSH
ncbi:MAG: radical SAM protein [Deltaproteobacteria bacterium]|nr:radical SAM protein [Deltaproteobacteria bacterium]